MNTKQKKARLKKLKFNVAEHMEFKNLMKDAESAIQKVLEAPFLVYDAAKKAAANKTKPGTLYSHISVSRPKPLKKKADRKHIRLLRFKALGRLAREAAANLIRNSPGDPRIPSSRNVLS